MPTTIKVYYLKVMKFVVLKECYSKDAEFLLPVLCIQQSSLLYNTLHTTMHKVVFFVNIMLVILTVNKMQI